MTEKEKFLRIETIKENVVGIPERENLGPDVQIVIDQKSGKIVKIGNPREIKEWMEGLRSQVALGARLPFEVEDLSLKDGKIIPGLVDTHTHPILYSMLEAVEPQFLFGVKEKRKLIDLLKERYKKNREPVLGLGWDTVALKDLSKEDLDEVCKEEPVIVIDPSFHGGIVNSKGIEVLSRLVDTYEKENKVKLKGELSSTGKITEEVVTMAFGFFESRKTIEEISETTVRWLERELNHGIADMHDMAMFTPFEIAAALQAREKWE
ncbi:MAG: amidohydrolase family protein, partial [Patescibacteria group bacterium]